MHARLLHGLRDISVLFDWDEGPVEEVVLFSKLCYLVGGDNLVWKIILGRRGGEGRGEEETGGVGGEGKFVCNHKDVRQDGTIVPSMQNNYV